MGNRRYSAEEKGKAVALAQEIGGSEAARKLEIPEDALYTWIAKAKKGTHQTESKPKEVNESADELDRLKEEIRTLKQKEKADKVEIENVKKEMKMQEDVIDFFINRQKK